MMGLEGKEEMHLFKFRLIVALAVVGVVIPSVASAQTSGPRVVTRDGVTTFHKNSVRQLGNTPMLRGFLSFDGVISSGSAYQTQPRLLPHAVVIQRAVVEPLTVVGRGLANQPVHPHLIELFLFGEGQQGSTTIFLDPDVDYENQGSLVLDKNHSINRAQRSTRLHRARGPMVIRGSGHQPVAAPPVMPRFIIQRPGVIEPKFRQKNPNDLKMVRRGN